MIIKTFTEESSAAALKRVREEMGGDAIVLKTRCVTTADRKAKYEVTACLERVSVAKASELLSDTLTVEVPETKEDQQPQTETKPTTPTSVKVASEAPSEKKSPALDERINSIDRKLNQLINLGIQPDGISRLEVFQTVHRQLKEADLPDDFLESFISGLVENYDGSTEIMTYAHQKLAEQLTPTIEGEIEFQPGDRVTFVGPAGAGKSSVMGKLAAVLTVKHRRKVKLLSLDDHKLAAFDEICSYADILGLEVIPPPDARKHADRDKDTITLIDSPAVPLQREKRQVLKQKIDEVTPRYRFAVFSCLTRSRDVFVISKMLKELDPTHLILTMEDITSCPGTFVTAALATGLKVAFMSDAPGGIGELKTPDAQALAKKLLDTEVSCD